MTPPSFLSSSALVALGGGFGAWLRFLTGVLWTRAIGPGAASAFPWSTLSVNVIGSLLMGLLAGWLAQYGNPDSSGSGEQWRLLLGTGVLGGYTTFSAFTLEFAVLVERGAIALASTYVAMSLAGGFAALFAGLYIMRALA